MELSILVTTHHFDETWIWVKLSARLFCEVPHFSRCRSGAPCLDICPPNTLLFSFNYEMSSSVEELCSSLKNVQVCSLWIYRIWAYTWLYLFKDKSYLEKTFIWYSKYYFSSVEYLHCPSPPTKKTTFKI